MHDLLFEGQSQWSGQTGAVDMFRGMAGELGLVQSQFDTCLDGAKYADRIAADQKEGLAEGITGTPSFRINGVPLSGAQPFEQFSRLVDYFVAGGQPPTMEVAADDFRSLGQADAPLVVNVFCDYSYQYCPAFAEQVIPELIAQYVDTGEVRLVYRTYPLGDATQKAAEAAMCAGQQGQYWEMNQKLFATQGDWAQEQDPSSFFRTYTRDLGLDTAAFDECLDSGAMAVTIQGGKMAAESAGINALPFVLVGDLAVRGELSMDTLGSAVDYAAAGEPVPVIVPTEDDWHVRGNPQTAKAVTIAFVDYASPESGDHARVVLPQLVDQYISTGQMLYVLHPWFRGEESSSTQAASAAECAGQQGKFWEMHDQIFAEQGAWAEANEAGPLFTGYAASLGLDTEQFETCLDSDWARLRVEAGNVVGAQYGVPSAPVFLFNNGQGRPGSPTFEEFKTVIDALING